ncbi:uncharacterized protein M421DRAFT_415572 [Didymella exigua CBS 183.55]|uniref:GPI anchored protein n=1 Tax=Didymella exigua CBS 183.55 TaxID=1150837 RepID=A0A6A5S192_9PLEO|nr:uncharacterized protein M421DRAFT_415572 [Didymella exigua CBS 183.55]KAF1933214.1 hypothetical protein M421DRAFT_415572 [Didymella exigua CBS 183.55]
MLHETCVLVLGLVAAASALESTYTGPMFNPSEAPYFDYSSLVIPTQTTLPAIQPTAEFSMATTISGIILPTTPLSRSSTLVSQASSHSSSHSVSSTASVSSSVSSSASRNSAATSASTSAPAQQSTAAAVANRAGVVGVVAGGLLAGLVLA